MKGVSGLQPLLGGKGLPLLALIVKRGVPLVSVVSVFKRGVPFFSVVSVFSILVMFSSSKLLKITYENKLIGASSKRCA